MLIPKSDHACCFNQCRPINLCNFSYKIVAKFLATRLLAVLDKIVSPNQRAFVYGRWISENKVVESWYILD